MYTLSKKSARSDYEGVRYVHRQLGIDFRAVARSTCFLVSSIATRKPHRPSPHVYASKHLGDMRVGWIYHQACLLALAGKYKDSLARFDEVLRLEPTYVHAWNQKGLCCYFLDDYALAIKNFQKASSLCPEYVEPVINTGCALQRLDLFDSAVQTFDNAEEIHPRLYETSNNKAISLVALGDFSGALTSVDRCILAADPKPSVFCLRSLCFFALERISEGVLDLEIALRLEPSNGLALVLRRAFYAYITA